MGFDLLLFLGIIVWVISAAGKRKQAQQQKAEAEARARAAAAAAAAEGVPDQQAARQEHAPLHPTVQPTLTPRSETPHGRQHTLEPSRQSGHAHMETSMSGFSPDCPPNAQPARRMQAAQRKMQPPPSAQRQPQQRRLAPSAADAAAPVIVDFDEAQEAFRFDPARVRDGLIYAEILAKPKALRRSPYRSA